MFHRISVVVAAVLCLAASASAQVTNVTIQPDQRLFTTMAALNAAGFDVEFASEYHPVRAAVREYAREVDPDLIARLKTFYTTRKGSQTDEEQLAKYISLAVNISDAPDFKPVMREEALPPDARSVIRFLDLMREFYEKAHLAGHWRELRPEYEKAIAEIGPQLRDAFVRTDAYMHAPLGASSNRRSLAIYVELAAPVNTVNIRSNQDEYYVVLGYAPSPKIDDIRHAYLHFQLDNLVAANRSRIQNPAQLLKLVKDAPGVDPAYTSDISVMVGESLIRAIELRMDRAPQGRAKQAVDAYYRSGLLLAPYFYAALQDYEQQDASLRDAFAGMARNVDSSAEQARFQQTFNQIPVPEKSVARPEVPQAPAQPPPDPAGDLLRQAESAFNAGDLAKAQSNFQSVLSDYDRNNGPAFYGLGLIASKRGDSEAAKQNFDRTIRSDSAGPGMKVWAYIYLARIFDLECMRDRAVEYYQQAVKLGDDTRNAQSVAREGVAKPYGGGCK